MGKPRNSFSPTAHMKTMRAIMTKGEKVEKKGLKGGKKRWAEEKKYREIGKDKKRKKYRKQ